MGHTENQNKEVNRATPTLASTRTCTGCMACIDSCPVDAISPIVASDGHYYIEVSDKCIACGKCERTCPVVTGYVYSRTGLSRPVAAWATDPALRRISSSGGIFGALARHVIGCGGMAAGVRLSGMNAEHIIIDKVEDLYQIQGSKYIQSNASGIYRQVESHLKRGTTVLFSGTGCQVAGLMCYLKRGYDNLITVDLICSGVPSKLLVDRVLAHEPGGNIAAIASFRDKSQGRNRSKLVFRNTAGGPVEPDDRIFQRGFRRSLTNRYSCLDCRFVGARRQADITLADYWGDKDFTGEHAEGLSLCFLHSEKAGELMARSGIAMHDTQWEKFLFHNPRMVLGKKLSKGQLFIRSRMAGIYERDPGSFEKIYGGLYSHKDLMYLPLRAFMAVSGRMWTREKKKILTNLLKDLS